MLQPFRLNEIIHCTKMKFSMKDFFSKCDQICRKPRIWSHSLKKFSMKNLTFCPALQYQKLFVSQLKLYWYKDQIQNLSSQGNFRSFCGIAEIKVNRIPKKGRESLSKRTFPSNKLVFAISASKNFSSKNARNNHVAENLH